MYGINHSEDYRRRFLDQKPSALKAGSRQEQNMLDSDEKRFDERADLAPRFCRMKMTGRTLRQEAAIDDKRLAGNPQRLYRQGRDQAGVDNNWICAVLKDRAVAQAGSALRATIGIARRIIARFRRVGRAATISILATAVFFGPFTACIRRTRKARIRTEQQHVYKRINRGRAEDHRCTTTWEQTNTRSYTRHINITIGLVEIKQITGFQILEKTAQSSVGANDPQAARKITSRISI